MKNNWQIYIIIGFFVIVFYMMMKMNRTLNLHSTLLVGMASKMGFKLEGVADEPRGRQATQTAPATEHEEEEEEEEEEQETAEQKELREENELAEAMVNISKKIKAKEKISKKENEYYVLNFGDMHENLQLADPSEILVVEKNSPADKKTLTREEKHALILTFFEDKTPKQVMPIAKLLAKATDTEPNKGNTHGLLKEMVEANPPTLVAYNAKGNKVFYVLPDWMEGKNKLKKEIFKNIA